jgi:membrane protein required for colicin V production
MDFAGMNWVDWAVVAIVLVSAAMAFFRGFVHEVLTIAAWFGAFLITLWLLDPVRALLSQIITVPFIASTVALAGTFIVSLTILTIVGHQIGALVRRSAVGPVDRSLGVLFGLLRGALIVCGLFLFLRWFVGDGPLPPVVAEARAAPWLARGADAIETLLPEGWRQYKDGAATQVESLRQSAPLIEQVMKGAQPTGKPSP